jgi:hypothetical protein
MVQNLRVLLSAFILVLLIQFSASAQNCTINAGAPRTICPGQPFLLLGAATGNFNSPAVWTQTSGPAVTVSTTTVASGNAAATVTGYVAGNVYGFRLSAKCTDGTPIQSDVVYTASSLTVANAGPSINACPGILTMAANTAKTGETGTWSLVSGNLPVPTPDTDPHATVHLGTNDNTVGASVFRWTITGGDGCGSTSLVTITNLGGVMPVTATSPISVGCYSVTGSVQLDASFGGDPNQPLQRGTWSFISGPSTPTFDNIHINNTGIHNLVQGTYIIRWIVAGQCANGSADVTINVDAPTQGVTGVGSTSSTYCDGRTSTTLNGPQPTFTNETVQWTAGANPTSTTFSSPNSPNTVITGLDGIHEYNFTYTITNNVTHCTASGNYKISYAPPPTITLGLTGPQTLACGVNQLAIPYTFSGGNQNYWELISAPSGATIDTAAATGGFNHFNVATAGTQTIVGLNLIGTYVIRFKRSSDNASGGCGDAFTDISIVVSKPPYQAIAGTSQFLPCHTTAATLAGNAPQAGDSGTGQWTQVSGPNISTIADKSLNTTAISNLITGVYTYRWIVSGGFIQCGDTQSDTQVIVAALPQAADANAGSNISSCSATPVKLNATPPLKDEVGTWSLTSEAPASPTSAITFSNVHDPAAIVSGLLTNKIYTLTWTVSNDCGTATSTLTITTGSLAGPKQALATTSTPCLPNIILPSTTASFNITGNIPTGGENGTWSLLSSPSGSNVIFNASTAAQSVTTDKNGTYQFVWSLNIAGCTSTLDTVSVTISPATTVAVIGDAPSKNICGLGPLPLVANSPTATEVGTWTQIAGPGGATITANNIASTTVTGLIEGRYTFQWTITNSACSSSSATVTYTLSNPPTTANAGPPITICDNTTTTLAANAPVVGTGLWSVVSGPSDLSFNDNTNPITPVSGFVVGTYILRWTISNGPGCPASTSDVIITVGQSAHAGVDQSLCNTTTTVLSGNENSDGTWTLVSSAWTIIPTPPTPPPVPTITKNSGTSGFSNTAIVTDLTAGVNYVFQYTIGTGTVNGKLQGGCGTLISTMNVSVSAPPTLAVAGPDQAICTGIDGTTITVTGNAPSVGAGQWNFLSQPTGSVAVITSPSSPSTTITNLSVAGVYLAQWTITNANCTGVTSSNDFTRITVSNPPTVSNAGAAQSTACKDNVVLTGNTPTSGNGTWTFVPNGVGDSRTPVISTPNSPTTTVTGLVVDSANPYVFSWTIASGGCAPSSSTVSVTVADNTPTVANAGAAQAVCTNGTIAAATMAATAVSAGNDHGTWTFVPADASDHRTPLITTPGSATTTITNLTAGMYVFAWTVSNNSSCTSTSNITITVTDPPSVADAGPTTASYCLFAPVVLAATAPATGTTGTWTVLSKPHTTDPDPVFSNVNDPNATVTGLVLGTYVLTWTTSNGGCTNSTDNITINISNCQIAISKDAPSTPTYNGDGTYNVTFNFHIKNTSGTGITVNNIQAQDDLTITFPTPKIFSIASITNISGTGLIVNNSFDGKEGGDQNLLNPSSSLASGVEEIITVVVKVKLD